MQWISNILTLISNLWDKYINGRDMTAIRNFGYVMMTYLKSGKLSGQIFAKQNLKVGIKHFPPSRFCIKSNLKRKCCALKLSRV